MAFSALLLLLSSLPQAVEIAPAPPVTTTITHVRVIDGTGAPARDDQTLVLRDGLIASMGPSARLKAAGKLIDGRGKTVMPGLINTHGHLALVDGVKNAGEAYTRANVLKELEQYERYGVTTMLSLGLNRDLIYDVRAEQRAGKLAGASLFVADRGLGVFAAAPPLAHAEDQLDTPRTVEEAKADVDAAAGRHTDFIKVWVDSLYGTKPTMSTAIYRAVIAEAHARHVPVAAHVFYGGDAQELVTSGVNVLAHSVRDLPMDQTLLAEMKSRGVFYVPTLTVDESFYAYADQPPWLTGAFFRAACSPEVYALLTSKEYREKTLADNTTGRHRLDQAVANANLQAALQAGVKVAFGTDSGANANRVPGFAEHHELAMMVASGLTPLQAIQAATGTSAELLGIGDKTGTPLPGHTADLILLDGNPLEDIHNTEKMVTIWHMGRAVPPMVPVP